MFAAREVLGLCFDFTTTVDSKEEDTCIGGLVKTDDKWKKGWQTTAFFNQVLRCVDVTLDTVGEVAKANGASEDTVKSIVAGRSVIKPTRTAIALVSLFRGTVESFVKALKNIFALAKSLHEESKDAVLLVKGSKKHNDIAVGKTEKRLALASQIGNVISLGGTIASNGICNPIKTIDDYSCDKDGRQLFDMGEQARSVGAALPITGFVSTIGGIWCTTCDIAFQEYALERAMKTADLDKQVVWKDYEDKIVGNILNLVDDGLNFTSGIIHFSGKTAPVGLRLPMSIIGAGIGLYKEWRKLA